MDEKREYLTKEKFDELSARLKTLKTDKRKEVADALDYARGLGDLSENAEYHEARETQAKLEDEISKLEAVLKNATVFEDRHGDYVMIGSTVTVENQKDKKTRVLHIVGSEESDISAGKISNRSPIGAAALGKKKGEAFTFTSPNGAMSYKVLDIK